MGMTDAGGRRYAVQRGKKEASKHSKQAKQASKQASGAAVELKEGSHTKDEGYKGMHWLRMDKANAWSARRSEAAEAGLVDSD